MGCCFTKQKNEEIPVEYITSDEVDLNYYDDPFQTNCQTINCQIINCNPSDYQPLLYSKERHEFVQKYK